MARVPTDFHRAFHSVVGLHSLAVLDLYSHTVVVYGYLLIAMPGNSQSQTLPPPPPPHVLACDNSHNTTQQQTMEPIHMHACMRVCYTTYTTTLGLEAEGRSMPWVGGCVGWVFFSFLSHYFFLLQSLYWKTVHRCAHTHMYPKRLTPTWLGIGMEHAQGMDPSMSILILIIFSVFVLKPVDRCTCAHLMHPTPATPTSAWPGHRACPRDGFKVGPSLFPHLIFLFSLHWKLLIDVYAPTCINPTRPQPGPAWAYVKCARDEIKVSTFSFSHYLSLSVVVLKPINRSCTHDPDLAQPGCRTCMRDGLKVGHFFHSSYFFFHYCLC